jgi:hypothetical protein
MSDPQPSNRPQAATAQITAQQAQAALERLRPEQNLTGALLAGLAASAMGAAVWAIVTDVTGYQIGFMAIGIGFIVGYAVRIVGKGLDTTFGYLAAALALLGCLVGNLLAVVGIVATEQELAFTEVLGRLDIGLAVNLMTATFSPIDLLFYAIATYEGYKLSFRRLTEDDFSRVTA